VSGFIFLFARINKLGFISLPPGGRGTTKWWKEPALQKVIIIFYYNAFSLNSRFATRTAVELLT